MLFILINLILLFSQSETFLLSLNNNRLFLECGRAIIIKNHYWFLSEFFNFFKSLNRSNNSIDFKHIPFDNLYSILNHILIHCQQAHQFYRKTKRSSDNDQLYRWFKSQIKP